MPNGPMQGLATSRSSSPYQHRQLSPNRTSKVISNGASASAALRGATLAFGKQPVISKQQPNSYSGKNEALAAASKAGSAAESGKQARSMEQARNTYTDYNGTSHLANTPLFAAQQSVFREKKRDISSKPPPASLQLPLGKSTNRTRSPSNIAATLAASRVTPQHSGNSVTGRSQLLTGISPDFQYSDEQLDLLPLVRTVKETKKQFITSPDTSSVRHASRQSHLWSSQNDSGSTDSTPIPPTNALIGIFEANHETSNFGATRRQEELPDVTPVPHFKLSTQKLPRHSSVDQTVDKISTTSEDSQLRRHDLPPPPSRGPKPSIDFLQSSDTSKISDSESAAYAIQIRDATLNSLSTRRPDDTGNVSKAQSVQHLKILPPKPPPTRRKRKSEVTPVVIQKTSISDLESSSSESSSSESFVSATEVKGNSGTLQNTIIRPITESFISRPILRSTSALNLTAQVSPTWQGEVRGYKMPSRISSQLTGESLADAIVASSLATSRAPSPTNPPRPVPPPPPRHPKSLSIFHHRHHSQEETRSASPAKGVGLRQTMRKIKSEDDEDDVAMHRRGRKRILRNHPNKHHEGDRKRWRDEITERERKRYEGVWAANKGLHPIIFPNPSPDSSPDSSPSPASLVSNLVTRDIWRRSRLSDSVLEEVWDLVNLSTPSSLTREEFVVGLWLIDQRLKGRKLPIRVSDSVWGSVRGPGGVRMPKQRKR